VDGVNLKPDLFRIQSGLADWRLGRPLWQLLFRVPVPLTDRVVAAITGGAANEWLFASSKHRLAVASGFSWVRKPDGALVCISRTLQPWNLR
jgi:hypothetical protein